MQQPKIPKALVEAIVGEEGGNETWGDAFEDAILDSAPNEFGGISLMDLSKMGIGIPLALAYIGAFVGLFLALTYSGTQIEVSKKFLSLDNSDPNSICVEVPTVVTGTFRGDYEGHWDTSQFYTQNKSIFAIEFVGSLLTTDQFTESMMGFRDKLAVLGAKSAARSPVWNMLVYSIFSFTDFKYNMRFYSTADAGIIWAQQMWTFAYSSRNGVCDTYALTGRWISGDFDQSTKRFVLHIPLKVPGILGEDQFNANAFKKNFYDSCPNQAPGGAHSQAVATRSDGTLYQSLVGPFITADSNSTLLANGFGGDAMVANFGFDVRSAALAIGLNFNLVDTAYLLRVDTVTAKNLGFVVYVDAVVDPPMDPIYCMDKTSTVFTTFTKEQIAGPQICFVMPPVNSGMLTLFYPSLNQFKTSSSDGLFTGQDRQFQGRQEMCVCPEDATLDYCQTNDFFIGFFYDNKNHTDTPRIGIEMQKLMLADPTNGDINIMRHFQDVISYTATIGYNPFTANISIASYTDSSGVKQGNAWAKGQSYNSLLRGAYDALCPWTECAGMVFESSGIEGNTAVTVALNRFLVRLTQFTSGKTIPTTLTYPPRNLTLQSCTDSVSNQEALLKLSQHPPQLLVQQYYQCTATLGTAIQTSIGNASASTSLYLGLSYMILGALSIVFVKRRVEQRGFVLVAEKKKAGLMWLHEKQKVRATRSLQRDLVRAVKFLLASNEQLSARVQELSESCQVANKTSAPPVAKKFFESLSSSLAEYIDHFEYVAEPSGCGSSNKHVVAKAKALEADAPRRTMLVPGYSASETDELDCLDDRWESGSHGSSSLNGSDWGRAQGPYEASGVLPPQNEEKGNMPDVVGVLMGALGGTCASREHGRNHNTADHYTADQGVEYRHSHAHGSPKGSANANGYGYDYGASASANANGSGGPAAAYTRGAASLPSPSPSPPSQQWRRI